MHRDFNSKNLDQELWGKIGREVENVTNIIDGLKEIYKEKEAYLMLLGLSKLKLAIRLTYERISEDKKLYKSYNKKFSLYLKNIYLMLYVLSQVAIENYKPCVFHDSRNRTTNKKPGEYAVCLGIEIPNELFDYDGRSGVLEITFEKSLYKKRVNFELLSQNNSGKRKGEKEIVICHESFRFDVIFGRFYSDLGTKDESWEYPKRILHYQSPMRGAWEDLFNKSYHFEDSEYEEEPSSFPQFFDKTFRYFYSLTNRQR